VTEFDLELSGDGLCEPVGYGVNGPLAFHFYSYIVGLGRTPPRDRSLLAPFPSEHERMVLSAFVDVVAMLDEDVANGLLGIGGARAELRQAIDHVRHQMKAVHLIQHNHVKRRRGRSFFFVAAHV